MCESELVDHETEQQFIDGFDDKRFSQLSAIQEDFVILLNDGNSLDDDSIIQTTFPQFEFTQDGTLYELDWNAFSQERKIAHGAWDEDWGYSKQGQPTLGTASMYDKQVSLTWDSKLPWWWILLAAAGLLLLVKLFSRRGRGQDV